MVLWLGETHTSCVFAGSVKPYHKLEPQALGSVFEILVYFPLSCSVAIDVTEVELSDLVAITRKFRLQF